ncbi:hypothetical protein DFH09DRAFT_1104884 [Mycena vulgaris]|nr:hypothetical protein DFH09DRAFT_1104884 [Mycena vulgaris]
MGIEPCKCHNYPWVSEIRYLYVHSILAVWVVAEVPRRWVYLRSVRIKSAPSIVNLQHEDPKIPQVLQDVSRDARHTCPGTRRDSRDPIRGDKGSRKGACSAPLLSMSKGYSHRPDWRISGCLSSQGGEVQA